MADEPKPINPERIAWLRDSSTGSGEYDGFVAELLADRDYHAQRAEHFSTVAAVMADMAKNLQQVAVAAGWPEDMPVEEPGELVECVAELRELAELGRQWRDDSSLAKWFPLTAERLQQAENETRAQRATLEATDAQFCRTLDALSARNYGDDETLPSEARSIIDEVARLRARVRVEAEDIERVGLTGAQTEAWLLANGWRRTGRLYSDGTSHWAWGDGGTDVLACDDATVMEWTLRTVVRVHARPGLDILDEMAAMPVTEGDESPIAATKAGRPS